jgi:hypothetical protein
MMDDKTDKVAQLRNDVPKDTMRTRHLEIACFTTPKRMPKTASPILLYPELFHE